MADHESVEALKVSDEYRALGVLGRERLLWATFPGLRERHRAESAEPPDRGRLRAAARRIRHQEGEPMTENPEALQGARGIQRRRGACRHTAASPERTAAALRDRRLQARPPRAPRSGRLPVGRRRGAEADRRAISRRALNGE
jgi:hypothetical protein